MTGGGRRGRLWGCLLACALLVFAPSERVIGALPQEVTNLEAARECQRRALKFLATTMERSGAFAASESADQHPRLALTALGCLAFLSGGSTADTGPYQTEIRQNVGWLLDRAQPAICECDAIEETHQRVYLHDSGDTLSRMHGHGYATWALALAYGMTFGEGNEQRRVELERTLAGAVHCIEYSQSETGGWYYEPVKGSNHEGSVTITVIQALRAARDAGMQVSSTVIDSAVRYVRRSQVASGPYRGGFLYKIGDADTNTTFALTAAAVSTLNSTGIYDSDNIDKGLDYMGRNDPLFNIKESRWPWYGRLYAAQAYFQFRDLRHFRKYYPEMVKVLVREQAADGSFSSSDYGEVYSTSMAAIALSVPMGYLPSFQR